MYFILSQLGTDILLSESGHRYVSNPNTYSELHVSELVYVYENINLFYSPSNFNSLENRSSIQAIQTFSQKSSMPSIALLKESDFSEALQVLCTKKNPFHINASATSKWHICAQSDFERSSSQNPFASGFATGGLPSECCYSTPFASGVTFQPQEIFLSCQQSNLSGLFLFTGRC